MIITLKCQVSSQISLFTYLLFSITYTSMSTTYGSDKLISLPRHARQPQPDHPRVGLSFVRTGLRSFTSDLLSSATILSSSGCIRKSWNSPETDIMASNLGPRPHETLRTPEAMSPHVPNKTCTTSEAEKESWKGGMWEANGDGVLRPEFNR